MYVAGPMPARCSRVLTAAFLLAAGTLLPGSAAAQVHPGGRWLTLETAHFHVHVRAEDRALGYEAAAEAETA